MPGESERRRGSGGRARGAFDETPAYLAALRLCGFVHGLDAKIPDDERPLLYQGLQRASLEIGAQIAAGHALTGAAAARTCWERARAALMESKHYVLVARSRYLLDERDGEAFEELYRETLEAIGALLGGRR